MGESNWYSQAIKQKLKSYAMIACYSAISMVGVGYFLYRGMVVQFQHHFGVKKARNIGYIHPKAIQYCFGALGTFSLYITGLVLIYNQLPQNRISNDHKDLLPYNQLINKQLQQQNIFKPMKLFGISQNLQQKARTQIQNTIKRLENQGKIASSKQINFDDLVIVKGIDKIRTQIQDMYKQWRQNRKMENL